MLRRAMKVMIFGATGMVGQGVLRECLLDPEVEAVLVVGRGATGQPALDLVLGQERGRDRACLDNWSRFRQAVDLAAPA